jgi:hypothetical protein
VAASTAPANRVLYGASSRGDGTYKLNVRGGFNYHLNAYVPVINGTTVTVSTHVFSGIAVSPGGTTTRNIP